MTPSRARLRRAATAAALGTAAALSFAGGAHASLGQLPPNAQVNDDPRQPAGASDVVGGSLAPAGKDVPWAAFEQHGQGDDGQQIFVRAFKDGRWTTRGSALNLDAKQEAEAPSIDFAGAGRTVPWVSWYEPSAALGGVKNIFASRFDTQSWVPEGADRTNGDGVPSVNIHTNREAENPSLAGGAAAAGNPPVPWIAWQERDPASTQIFVSRGDRDATCGSLHLFCWRPTGIKRVASGQNSLDPSLNIDVKRDGVEPDIAFTGRDDTTPWVVWYEQGTGSPGLRDTEQVFAARAVPAAPADNAVGGFKWVAVGNGTADKVETLDRPGDCASGRDAEDACSLNAVAGHPAVDPRIAAGSLVPGGTAVPWVVWSEKQESGKQAIFVSRLVAGTHFELFNHGLPVSDPANDATTPDIAFAGNEPYITWNEDVDGHRRTFSGHFEGGASAPAFHLDTPQGLPDDVQDLRPPVSSGCTANPSTGDGVRCPGGAAGTPSLLQTTTDGRLLAHGYAAGAVVTGGASAVTGSTAHVDATADPGGAPVEAHVEFGPTTAYGSRTDDQRLAPGAGAFAADLTGLPAGTTIHYRAVADTDFGSVAGDDRTLVTAAVAAPEPATNPSPNPGSRKRLAIRGSALRLSRTGVVRVELICPSGPACRGTLKLRAGRALLGAARFSIRGGHSARVSVRLNRKAVRRIRRAHRLKIRLSAAGRTRTLVVKV